MEDSQFLWLKRIEPSTVELTREQYEERMGIGQPGQASKEAQDVRQSMGKGAAVTTSTQVQDSRTKKELIQELEKRGFKTGELNRKNKSQLIDMI